MPSLSLQRRFRRWFCLPMAIILALHTFAHAQEDAPVLEVNFRTFFLHPTQTEYTYFNGSAFTRFPTATDALSQVQQYRGPGPLLVFQGTPDPELPLAPQAVLSIPLTPQMRQVTIVCSSNSGVLRYMAIDSNLNAIPRGSFCFINATTNAVVGLLEQRQLTVNPGQHSILSPGISEDKREPIRMAYRDGENWELFYSSMWTVSAERRTLIIIYNSPNTEKLTVRGVNLR